jgi:hypothetical protein
MMKTTIKMTSEKDECCNLKFPQVLGKELVPDPATEVFLG